MKQIFAPLSLLVPVWIPTNLLANCVLAVVPASFFPSGATGAEILVSSLQVLSLSAGVIWIAVQIYIKWPEIIKRFKSRKHGNKG